MQAHHDRDQFLHRLRKVASEVAAPFAGDVYRFIDPQFTSTKQQFEGRGAAFCHGRWHLRSDRLISYTSCLPETALQEALSASRYYGLPDRRQAPMVFVSAASKLSQVIDLCDGKVRQRLKLSLETITKTDWRHVNGENDEAITQAWGWAFYECGVEGILCPSAADPNHSNLISFPYNFSSKSHIHPFSEVIWPRD